MLQYEMDEGPRTFLVITKDGKLEPGPGLSLDKATTEAAEMLAKKFSALHQAQAAIIASLRAALDGSTFSGFSGFGVLIMEAVAEADKAMQKYPQPNYIISKIAEEAGEVVKAAIHCAEKRETAENVAAEMKQLLAMLIRLWVEGDQVHGLPPIAATTSAALGYEPFS